MRKKTKKLRLVELERAQPDVKQESEDEEEEHEHAAELEVIVKADVLGSLEAFIASLKKLETDDVKISVLKQGLGNITESDLTLAEDSGAVVYGFNVRLSQEARQLSYNRKSDINISKIIYELLDDAKERLARFVKKEIVEIPQGEFEVLKVFRDARAGSIIGGRVKKAAITPQAKFRLLREGEPIDEGKVLELQQNKQTVDELKEGVEGGLKVSGARIKEGDVLSCFVEEEREVK